jgi:hypothetical protein
MYGDGDADAEISGHGNLPVAVPGEFGFSAGYLIQFRFNAYLDIARGLNFHGQILSVQNARDQDQVILIGIVDDIRGIGRERGALIG